MISEGLQQLGQVAVWLGVAGLLGTFALIVIEGFRTMRADQRLIDRIETIGLDMRYGAVETITADMLKERK